MKMKFLSLPLLLILILFSSVSKAQYVTIPDDNFGSWLSSNGYSGCVSYTGTVWQIDTTCAATQVIPSMMIFNQNSITRITGIQYFKLMDTLSISQTTIDSIFSLPPALRSLTVTNTGGGSTVPPSHLPATLTYLNLSWDGLNVLPTLPASLLYLNASVNSLTSLPALPSTLTTLIVSRNYSLNTLSGLPAGLRRLVCEQNTMFSLPTLPASLVYLDCSLNHLTSIPAPLPASLDTMVISENAVTSLPTLPGSLVYLECSSNNLAALPALPASLTYLSCGINSGIHTLPASLPAHLQLLSCNNDSLAVIPALPGTLTYLDCNTNQLTTLPSLPPILSTLGCQFNLLTSLPALPDSLVSLNCSFNNLGHIPALPAKVQQLQCMGDNLTSLPALPTTLLQLACDSNSLTSLPSLPSHLWNISCSRNQLSSLGPFGIYDIGTYEFYLVASYNQLTSISPLPTGLLVGYSASLDLSHNQLTTLPAIDGFYTVDISYNPHLSCLERITNIINLTYDNTAFTCMPNRFTASSYSPSDPNVLPLCNPTSGCPFYYNLSGTAYQDTMSVCATALPNGPPMAGVKVLMSSGGQVVKQTYTYGYGQYSIKTDSIARYSLTVDTTGTPFTIICPHLSSLTDLETPFDTLFLDQDFGLDCRGVDNGVTSIYGRIRFAVPSTVSINAGDMANSYGVTCANHSSGTVTTTISGGQFVSAAPGAMVPAISGNTLVYTVADFNSAGAGAFNIIILADSNSAIGQSVCITTTVSTNGTVDINPADNSLTQCIAISNSFDPNEKQVSPQNFTPQNGWLTYTVDFQNTGNDTAYTVIVKDTLDTNLDPLSFQFLSSSNKVLVDISGNVVTFLFPQIDLLDSAHSVPKSMGWLQYKIRTKPGLTISSHVKNTAYIYFDQNPAVVTNTVTSGLDTTTHINVGIKNIQSEATIMIFPNPAVSSCTIVVSDINESYNISLVDVSGRLVGSPGILQNGALTFSVSPYAKGIYMLQMTDIEGRYSIRKLVIE